MTRYKMTICYDGEKYFGFQRQPNLPTIQQEIEKCLEIKLRQPTPIVASGRTDAGVHAIGQVAHFDALPIDKIDNFVYAINCMLPKDISIVNIEQVADNFHARYDAKQKTYIYKIFCSSYNAPLYNKHYHICHYKLNIEDMIQACKYFVGEHDFRSFMLTDETKENTIRTIYDLHLLQPSNNEIIVSVTGNGFLHNMVRSIVGTLIDVGRGRFSPNSIPQIISSCDRKRAGKTLEAKGLYLYSVEY